MSSPMKQPAIARRPKPEHAVKQRREPKLAHSDIARMARVEAEHRGSERHEMIATAAYFRAQQRGFEPGHELEDWFAAESEVIRTQQLALITSGADTP